MTKTKTLRAMLVTALLAIALTAAGMAFTPARAEGRPQAGANITEAVDPVAVLYDGKAGTGFKSFQNWAGFTGKTDGNGMAWILGGDVQPDGGHRLGSTASDNRQMTVSMVISNPETTDVVGWLRLFIDTYGDKAFPVTLNGQPFTATMNSNAKLTYYRQQMTFVPGENTVTVAFPEGYDAWLNGFDVVPADLRADVATALDNGIFKGTVDPVVVNFTGDSTGRYSFFNYAGFATSTADTGAWWVSDLLDSALYADGGYKFGSGASDGRQADISVKIVSAQACDVILNLYGEFYGTTYEAMTVTGGAKGALEGETAAIAVSLETATPQTVTLSLPAGYDAWLSGFSVEPIPEAVLTLDTTGVKTQYNPYDALDLTGLTASFAYNGTTTENIALADLNVDDSKYRPDTKGDYELTVTYTQTESGKSASKALNVKVMDEGLARPATAALTYDGESQSAVTAVYGPSGMIGVQSVDGGMYWIGNAIGGSFTVSGLDIGSNTGDNRKAVFSFPVNADAAGEAYFELYGTFDGDHDNTVKVNGEAAQVVNFHTAAEVYDGNVKVVTVKVALAAGANTITVEAGSDGTMTAAYGMWLKAYSVSPVPAAELTLHTAAVKTTYALYETLDLTGLTGEVVYDGQTTRLTLTDMTVDSAAFDASTKGTYKIIASYSVSDGVSAEKSFDVTVGGNGTARTGTAIAFDGTETAVAPVFTADQKVGLNGKDGAMYWALEPVADAFGSGYKIGSSATDARRLTMTFTVAAAAAGKVDLILYAQFYARESSRVRLSVGDGAETTLYLFEAQQNDAAYGYYSVISLDLEAGENVVTLKFTEGYDAWFNGYKLAAGTSEPDPDPEDPGTDEPGDRPGDNEPGGEEPKGCGCGSVFGAGAAAGGAAVILTAFAAALLLRRKKRNQK